MRVVPDPREQPTISVDDAAQLLSISRDSAYSMARAFLSGDPEGLPVIRVGERGLRVVTAHLLARLGLETDRPHIAGSQPQRVVVEVRVISEDESGVSTAQVLELPGSSG